MTLQQSTT